MPNRTSHPHPRLDIFALKVMDALLSSGHTARWSYRVGLQGRLRVSRYEVTLQPGRALPRPLLIAFASDFHAGPSTHPQVYTEVFTLIREASPDLLLLGGDYVCYRPKYVELRLETHLSQCRPPLGKYAVLGNHDHWAGAQVITQSLEKSGVTVLVNRNVQLPAPFDNVRVCGIDDPWSGAPDIAKAFADVAGSTRIFLSHSPDGLLLVGGEKFDVGFAGHTHGGQIALPNGTAIISAGGPLARSHSRGRFENTDNGPMIVSRGVGCSTVPVRINSDPELILTTLR